MSKAARAVTARSEFILPRGYDLRQNLRETEKAIKMIKDHFQEGLARALNLSRVTAPILVPGATGINDYLTGTEEPVRFHVKALKGEAEIVQSLAKWKRLALGEYAFEHGEGLYTDMNAIRPDEILDNLHSIYVDQWDWERIITAEERNIPFLKEIVRDIYDVILDTEEYICDAYPSLPAPYLPNEISFIHSEELQTRYPDLSPREREDAICRQEGAVFIIGIGATLSDGQPHDERAADYDDWSTETGDGKRGLNGDLLVWYPLLDCAMELSSMGIRVDKESLLTQLEIKEEMEKLDLYFHRKLMAGELPLTIGGGIGQSRLCMLFLRRAHVGEVQASLWPEEMIKACEEHGIFLL
ncbi:MAG: aspartate--ammonia ligase [Chloroflexota bacterium]|nr:aspartate--ammonia ligase [Chloroflexota bacterium]